MHWRLSAFAFLAFASAATQADIGWTVSFDDPGGTYSAYYADIASNMLAAGNLWGNALLGSGTIDIEVGFADIPTANGGSVSSSYAYTTSGGINVFHQGAAAEIITGVDPNGSAADIHINIGSTYQSYLGGSYLDNMWFDPDPSTRTTPLPDGRTDAMSTFLHEIGHGLAFNGWRDGTTGSLPGNYESTFDSFVENGPNSLTFNGANAMAAYGGPVPLTVGNYGHYGNAFPGPGSDLVNTLMNGVVYYYGSRWTIGDLDRAILKDVGFTLAPVPEPTTIAVFGLGLAAFARRRKRR